MTLQDLKDQNLIVFECLSGSRAFGLATESSDIDIKGVFVAPPEMFFGFDLLEQIHDDSHDIVYYELKKFLVLLARNNPNALEMLFTPQRAIQIETSDFSAIRSQNFLSKMCEETFANYAWGQIKKAKGLNKKIVNPMPKDRQDILEFCYIAEGAGSIRVREWLLRERLDEKRCGLSKIPNFRDVYAVFTQDRQHPEDRFNGFVRTLDATELCLSSVPKGYLPSAYLHFNRDAFKAYCEQHREYWAWIEKRNPDRYATNVAHGKNYDSKNMMHVFRLLSIARMIATQKTIDFGQLDRDFLLKVKVGEFDYDDLVERAQQLVQDLNGLYTKSDLPSLPNLRSIEHLHWSVRTRFYTDRGWLLPTRRLEIEKP